MISQQSTDRRPPALPLPRHAHDPRRHKRISVTLLGRYMREDKSEYPCKLIDISVGGAAIVTPVTVRVNERIIVYFDHLGGLEGTVTRTFEGGFAIKITATQHKREKLAAQLTWLINRHEVSGLEERRHERAAPRTATSTISIDEGPEIPCQILDFSISGASIATAARPQLGQEVLIGGKLRALVVRHHSTGVGVQFLDIQSPAALKQQFE